MTDEYPDKVTITPKLLKTVLPQVSDEKMAQAYMQEYGLDQETANQWVADHNRRLASTTAYFEARMRETMSAMLIPVETKDNQSGTL